MNSPAPLNPNWITGFVDGEGCFHIGINRNPQMTLGYQVLPEFTVVQHQRDIELLNQLKDYFGCGVVRVNHGDRFAYRVRARKDLESIIIPFFETYTLRSQKHLDFLSFTQVLSLMDTNSHLTDNGLHKIRQIVAGMNRTRVHAVEECSATYNHSGNLKYQRRIQGPWRILTSETTHKRQSNMRA